MRPLKVLQLLEPADRFTHSRVHSPTENLVRIELNNIISQFSYCFNMTNNHNMDSEREYSNCLTTELSQGFKIEVHDLIIFAGVFF